MSYQTRSTDDGNVERCAPVQGSLYSTREERIADATPPGSISWEEHLEAYAAYSALYGKSQTPERLAERGGFGHGELLKFLGRKPTTFRRRSK